MTLHLPAGTYRMTGGPAGGSGSTYSLWYGVYTGTKYASSGYDYGDGVNFTVADPSYEVRIETIVRANYVASKPMICFASETDSTFEVCSAKKYNSALLRTVYGGKFNLNRGILTVTHKMVSINSLIWNTPFQLIGGNHYRAASYNISDMRYTNYNSVEDIYSSI